MTRTMKYAALGVALASAAGVAGCAARGAQVAQSPEQELSADQAVSAPYLSGKVVEAMDAGGYTYLLLEKEGKLTWAALPPSKVSIGQQIKILGGAVMPNFESRALNRTFDQIVFSGGVYQEAPSPSAAPSPAALPAPAGRIEPVLAGKVLETMDAASYTYLLLEKEGKRGWAAVPNTEVKVGEEIELIPGINMANFKSTALKRNFEAIHFSAGIKGDKERKAAKAAALPPGHPQTEQPAKAKAPAGPPITGKVVEVAHGGGYTFICLEKEGVKTWAAVPAMEVAVGEELTLPPGNVMNNFVAKSMGRTFDKIIFTNRPRPKQK